MSVAIGSQRFDAAAVGSFRTLNAPCVRVSRPHTAGGHGRLTMGRMPNVFDAIAGNAPIADVAAAAACDVALACALLAAVVAASKLLEHVAVRLTALVAGLGSARFVECCLTYPGVVWHELSHALFALVTGARVTSISLRRHTAPDGGSVLGSVQFVPRGPRVVQSFQLLATGIAPAVTGLAGMAAIVLAAFPHCTRAWHWVLWGYLLACLLLHSGLSRQDLRGVWSGLPLVLAILFAVFLVAPFDAGALAQSALSGAGSAAGAVAPA